MANKTDQLRVYLTSASTVEPLRREVYENVRDTLLKLGTQLTYDWLADKNKYLPKELFQKTLEGMLAADVVVAEVTYPSTGVGQQISTAIAKKIPVITLKADWVQPSVFTPGAEGEDMKYLEYNHKNLRKLLQNSLKMVRTERFIKFNFISTPEINEELEKASEKEGISRSQLLRQIVREWMEKRN